MTFASTPKPASTLVLWTINHQAKVFMLKRQSQSGIWANAHVFPGGAVDEDDLTWALELPSALRRTALQALDPCESDQLALAFFLAAIRETAEESGFLFALDASGAPPGTPQVDSIINGLNEGQRLRQLFKEHALEPNIKALRPISWWITPIIEKRRYDTRFFAAEVPSGQNARVNLAESSAGVFVNPKEALQTYKEGHLLLAPPTLAVLERLSNLTHAGDLANLFNSPNEPICPKAAADENGQFLLVLPGDPLYSTESTNQASFERTRFRADKDGRFV